MLYPVYFGSYERRTGRESTWADRTRAYRDWVMRQVADARRSVDYLQSRADVRGDAIGYYGYSWGARSGPLVLAVEPRLRAGVLMSGGLAGDPSPDIDPFNFSPRVTVPVLMINGDSDFIFELERAQKPLFAAPIVQTIIVRSLRDLRILLATGRAPESPQVAKEKM